MFVTVLFLDEEIRNPKYQKEQNVFKVLQTNVEVIISNRNTLKIKYSQKTHITAKYKFCKWKKLKPGFQFQNIKNMCLCHFQWVCQSIMLCLENKKNNKNYYL